MNGQPSLSTFRSDFKTMGEKRTLISHSGKKQDIHRKRMKMSDLGSAVDCAESTKEEEQSVQLPLDLNNEACCARYSTSNRNGECAENPSEVSLPGKLDKERHIDCVKSKGINVDLNSDDVTNSVKPDPANSHNGQFKTKDVSESGSCTGPMEEKDPLRIWKEMKQSGFLSSSHGGIPVPKQRGRKCKKDVLKKKMELAKKEQVNRFVKIAAPSGLLNELNPSIINHVRNRKQVRSIIEALVRSEKNENGNVGSKQAANITSGRAQVSKRDLATRKCPATMYDDCRRIVEGKVGNDDTCTAGRGSIESCVSQSTHVTEDDILALKLSSSTKASLSLSSLSNEESSNFTSVSSLSLKAATVASQWLGLLYRDIKGRLSALRRSRRRVRAVITTELPFLLLKEFSNNQENDAHVMRFCAGFSNNKTADMHRARWTCLFDQMDQTLSQEEKLLGSWLNQVKEKQLLCDQGLQHLNCDTTYSFQQLETSENDSRVWVADRSAKQLAINAAAASIYSACNFLLSDS